MNPNIPQLHEGKLEVVTKNTAWQRGLAAVSSFGFGGKNVHLILSPPPESEPIPNNNAFLTVTSGRTKEACKKMIEAVRDHPDDISLSSLITDGSWDSLTSHPFRGFTVLTDKTEIQETQVSTFIKPDHICHLVMKMLPASSVSYYIMS